MAGLEELAGDCGVGVAGGGIPAGVVVDCDYGGGGETYGLLKYLSGVDETGGEGAGRDLYVADDVVFAVEAKDPEFFNG